MSCKHEGGTDPCARDSDRTCKARKRQLDKARKQTAEYKAQARAYWRSPEAQEAAKRRWQSPEYKARQTARYPRQQSAYRRLKYGIDSDDFATWLQAQGNRCRICKTDQPGGRGSFCIDHCHDTGKLRGILCSSCNTAIGMMQDDPGRLREAALYLERTATAKRRAA